MLSGGKVSVATEATDASDGTKVSNETGKQMVSDPANGPGNCWVTEP